jgi:hypothetical protein
MRYFCIHLDQIVHMRAVAEKALECNQNGRNLNYHSPFFEPDYAEKDE